MRRKLIVNLIIVLLTTAGARAADIERPASQKWRQNTWDARWITPGEVSETEFEVYRFRKDFHLVQVPASFVINVSADPRYDLFVNGERVHRGPARSSLQEWFYETLDIADFLRPGDNTIAATVWNYGRWSGGSQVSMYTSFIVQGETEAESAVNTDASWRSLRDPSHGPSLVYLQDVGPGIEVDTGLYPWGWNEPGYDCSAWAGAVEQMPGQPAAVGNTRFRPLTPRTIPLMESRSEQAPVIRRTENVTADDNFRKGEPLTVPPGTKAVILLDQAYLTNAYPTLTVSGGKGSKIAITYSEAMYINDRDKGNRNEIEGKHIRGYVDVFYPDGQPRRNFMPLWFRCYRYVQLDIQTGDEPLVLESWEADFTGYPFTEKARFECDDPLFHEIWNVGWRTARLCAGETYYDCPYYEQLQYTGDTRIQALISLYVSGDDRLMRRAINDFASSITTEGILKSRYPAKVDQIIPGFSLYWINMLHDYWMHRDDEEFVGRYIPVMKSVLAWYERKIDPSTGMLGAMPYWNFTDWPKAWPWTSFEPPTGGVPPGGREGGSSIMSLQLAYTLGDAVEILRAAGEHNLADKYQRLKDDICQAVNRACYDPVRKLYTDDLAATSYSQHASIMGILSGAVPEGEQQEVFRALTTDRTLVPATVYYQFYLMKALIKAGLGDEYTEHLDTWKEMIAGGLTTFAEEPEPTRSDCHAWSASPNYYFMSNICGIRPASPGFRTVIVEPHPGSLGRVNGSVPHPYGDIEVSLQRNGEGLAGEIILPAGLHGTYIHGGEELPLSPGRNELR